MVTCLVDLSNHGGLLGHLPEFSQNNLKGKSGLLLQDPFEWLVSKRLCGVNHCSGVYVFDYDSDNVALAAENIIGH